MYLSFTGDLFNYLDVSASSYFISFRLTIKYASRVPLMPGVSSILSREYETLHFPANRKTNASRGMI